MSKKDEALKLALEALEQIAAYRPLTFAECSDAEAVMRIAENAIPYLQEALAEQPAQQQEPVAWRNAALRVGEDLCSVGPFGYYDMTAEQWLDWALSVVTVHAPPASKPWVGLTDEEMHDCWDSPLTPLGMKHVRMIEAKLREKNT